MSRTTPPPAHTPQSASAVSAGVSKRQATSVPVLPPTTAITAHKRRTHDRIDLCRPVQLHTVNHGNLVCTARNVSVGGIYLQEDTPLSLGEECLIHLTLPGGSGPMALTLMGQVVRRDASGIGVAFNEQNELQRLAVLIEAKHARRATVRAVD